jgi:tRNA (Thr-GGU) A37 N-methylase
MMAQKKNTNTIQYTPIGKYHTDYAPATGVPRQGILIPETKGIIEIYSEYHDALQSLDLFEYIIILYHFSEVEKWESTVNPHASSHEHNFGLFSTRSLKRSNSIGLSILKIEKVLIQMEQIKNILKYQNKRILLERILNRLNIPMPISSYEIL